MNKCLLIQATARRLPLASGSVQCCVTSPPYWSLRDYGLPPEVWGGDEGCEHEWSHRIAKETRGTTATGLEGSLQAEARRFDKVSSTCCRCGAWRGNLGLEPTPDLFIGHLVEVFREVRRVLRDDGTLWVNIGDSYNASNGGGANSIGKAYGRTQDKPGHDRACRVATAVPRNVICGMKPKDRVGIPHMLAFALRADGWYFRDEIIWAKPNPMPESVTDRCTKAHEYIFLFSKSPRYFYDADALREPVTSTRGASFGPQTKQGAERTADGGHALTLTGDLVQSRKLADPSQRNHPLGRNKRSVRQISTQSCPEAHFATFPVKLPRFCIQAGTSERGCCPKCAAPWKRVVERIRVADRPGRVQGRDGDSLSDAHGPDQREGNRHTTQTVSTVWLPSCQCHAGDPVPCVVLDNFNGAATTGIAARQLGRRYVGIERKPEYLAISQKRLENAAAHGFKVKVKRSKRPRAAKAEPSLFPEVA